MRRTGSADTEADREFFFLMSSFSFALLFDLLPTADKLSCPSGSFRQSKGHFAEFAPATTVRPASGPREDRTTSRRYVNAKEANQQWIKQAGQPLRTSEAALEVNRALRTALLPNPLELAARRGL